MDKPSNPELVDGGGLRERLPQKAESVEIAQEAVKNLNDFEQKHDGPQREKRTYGRTPDGKSKYHCIENIE